MQGPALTTRAARETDWSVLVATGKNGTASGELYLDDGESLLPNATKHVDFRAAADSLRVSVRGAWKETNPLANVTVLGIEKQPALEKVVFNGQQVGEELVEYNASSKVLSVTGLQGYTKGGAFEENWVLKWA